MLLDQLDDDHLVRRIAGPPGVCTSPPSTMSLMPDFKRLLGAAAKALGDSSSRDGRQQQPSNASGTDWRDLVRTAADKLTGDGDQHGAGRQPGDGGQASGQQQGRQGSDRQQDRPQAGGAGVPRASEADRIALGKYDYLLRTAEPEQLEQVHRDAFARLTPQQRELVQARLAEELPAHEQPRSGSTDDLARAATRGETAHPGLMQRVFGGHGRPGSSPDGSPSGTRPDSGAGRFAAGAAAGAGVAALGGLALAVAGGAAVSSVAGPLLSGALADGIDFGGLAEGFGLEGVTGLSEGLGGLGESVDGIAQGGEEYLGGLGDQLGGLGEGFQIPGLGDLFDR
jgi:hypothetical protein